MTKPLGSFGAAASQNAALQAYLGRRRKEKILDLVLPIFGVAGLLVFWWAVVKGFHVRPFIAPSPLWLQHLLRRITRSCSEIFCLRR